MKKYDVAILGAGAAGITAAIEASELNVQVALIERADVGGVSLHEGCIPVKSLVASEKMWHHVSHSQDYGLRTVNSPPLLGEWISRQRNIISKLVLETDQSILKHKNITLLRGAARLLGDGKVAIVKNQQEEILQAEHVLIATGSRPALLQGIKIDGTVIGTSTHFVHRTKLPKRLLVVGGGYIGCELGGIYASLGSEVTIVEAKNRLLPGMEFEAGEFLERQFKLRGIEILLGQTMEKATVENHLAQVTLGGKSREFDAVLIAVGRTPNLEELGLDEAGVQYDRAIMVDHHLKTTSPGIFAIGDVNGLNPLAHSAMAQARVAVANAFGEDQRLDFRQVPYCVYTNPEITAVGHSETSAQAVGHETAVIRIPFRQIGRSVAMGETEGFVKLIADSKTHRILGGMIIGVQATELIGTLTLMLRMGATLEHLADSIVPHPSLTEAIQVAAIELLRQIRQK